MEHEGAGILVRVDIPDLKSQTRVIINNRDPVRYAKQTVLDKLPQELPIDVANNYGLYLPSMGGTNVGKFLDETRPFADYSLQGLTRLELRYKRRDYGTMVLTEKALTKANSKSNLKKLVEYINSGSVKKLEKILEAGLDSNFIMEDGNTPLGVACGRNGHVECILPLLSGGAHLDFRGSHALTPLHRAAIGGNSQAMKILLSLGASPNYIDTKGLTPLYHTAIMGDDIAVCEALLKHRAQIGIVDSIGWTELHQIAKHGHHHMLDIMLLYGADIDAQNKAGNTPLHVAAQHGQLKTALHLMKRGAQRGILNASKQPPNQIAILCGHHKLAKEIANFNDADIDIVQGEAVFNPKARHPSHSSSITATDDSHTPIPIGSTSTLPHPKTTQIPKLFKGHSSIAPHEQQEARPKHNPPPTKGTKKATTLPRNKAPPPPVLAVKSGRRGEREGYGSGGVDNIDSSCPTGKKMNQSPPQHGGHRYSTDRKKPHQPDSILTSSTSSNTSSPLIQSVSHTALEMRERLYPCTPGKKYVATMTVQPQQDGDLLLEKGMEVEVLYIGKGGFWEGKTTDQRGWFPQNAIKELTQEAITTKATTEDKVPSKKSGIKVVQISRTEKGFGFAMRGIKAVNIEKFKPSPKVPALQYVARVDKGGAAEIAGLEKGDFIIEVNGVNTTYSTHEDVVSIIKRSTGMLKIKLITPIGKEKTSNDNDTLAAATDQSLCEANSDDLDMYDQYQENDDRECEKDNSSDSESLNDQQYFGPAAWDSSQEGNTEDEEDHVTCKPKISASMLTTLTHTSKLPSATPPSPNDLRSRYTNPTTEQSPSSYQPSSTYKKETSSSNSIKQGRAESPLVNTSRPSQDKDTSEAINPKSTNRISELSSSKKQLDNNSPKNRNDDLSKKTTPKTSIRHDDQENMTVPAIKYNKATAKMEELQMIEQARYEQQMKEEEEEEESLSEFAKQLRQASKDYYKRASLNAKQNSSLLKKDNKPGQEIVGHESTSKNEIKSDSSSTSFQYPIGTDLVPDIMYKNYSNNDDDDEGWEYTETLTSWEDVSLLNETITKSSPKSRETIKQDKCTEKNVSLNSLQDQLPSMKTLSSKSESPQKQKKLESSDTTSKIPSPKNSPTSKKVAPPTKPKPSSIPRSSGSASSITKLPELLDSSDKPMHTKHLPKTFEQKIESFSKVSPTSEQRIDPVSMETKLSPMTEQRASPLTISSKFSCFNKEKEDFEKEKANNVVKSSGLFSKSNTPTVVSPKVSKGGSPVIRTQVDDKLIATSQVGPVSEQIKMSLSDSPTDSPVSSLKDKFEKLAKSQTPVFHSKKPDLLKSREPSQHSDSPQITSQQMRDKFSASKKQTTNADETNRSPQSTYKEIKSLPTEEETVDEEVNEASDNIFLPPPIFDDPNDYCMSVVMDYEDLPLPAELLEEMEREEDIVVYSPPPPHILEELVTKAADDDKDKPFPLPLPYEVDHDSIPEPIDIPPPVLTPEPIDIPPPVLTPEPIDIPPPVLTSEPIDIPPPVLTSEPIDIPPPVLTPEPIDIPPPVLTPEPIDIPPPVLTPEPIDIPPLESVDIPLPVPSPEPVDIPPPEPLLELIYNPPLVPSPEPVDIPPPEASLDIPSPEPSPEPVVIPPPDPIDLPPPMFEVSNDEEDDELDRFVDLPPPEFANKLEVLPPSDSTVGISRDTELEPVNPTGMHKEQADLLDNIMGELIKLTKQGTVSENETDSDSDDDRPPPPLPSCPPPQSDEEEAPEMPLFVTAQDDDQHINVENAFSFTIPPPSFNKEEEQEDETLLPPHFDLPPPLFAEDEDIEDHDDYIDLPPPSPLDLSDGEYEFDVPLPVPQFEDSGGLGEKEEIMLPPPSVEMKDESPTQCESVSDQPIVAPVKAWSIDDVCNWLSDIGLESYCQIFQDNEIIGEHLLNLSRDDLKDLGVTKIGHIKTLTQKLQQLQN